MFQSKAQAFLIFIELTLFSHLQCTIGVMYCFLKHLTLSSPMQGDFDAYRRAFSAIE